MSERNVLPKAVSPSEYWLHITPNFTNFTFVGKVKIRLHCETPVTEVKLNALELTFQQVKLEHGSESQTIPADTVVFDKNNMTAAIPLSQPVSGEAFLHIDYEGIINDSLAGFYRSKYTTSDGREIVLGTTQFEAVDARRALPCWDEPSHKAVFHVTITAPSHLISLSNMEVAKKEEDASAKTVTWVYAPTPKMSTYLLAWTIGELDVISTTVRLPFNPDRDTVVSVYTPLGKAKSAEFALDVATKVLVLYENFFDYGYNLKKLDLIAIPDFAAGAMENWGLITYREAALLCDSSSSAAHRQYVAIVVAHELAHQWFGNLVTMEWWKELWLNEAFATYMEYWAVNKLFPESNVFSEFVQSDGSSALQLDAMRSSHPVEVDVNNAQEIDEIFDAISYSKGGCIVRMAIEYIGEEAFQKGISAYIKNFLHSNATTVDLWNFLGTAAGKDLSSIMKLWTSEQGYPYLTVRREEPGALKIKQNRFLITGDASPEEDAVLWKIPLLLKTPEKETTIVIGEREEEVKVDAQAPWIKANSRQTAFCRVKYDTALFQSLLPALAKKELCDLDRLSVVADYHAFAKAGYVPSTEALELLKQFANEDDFNVWSAIISLEADIKGIVNATGEEGVEKYNEFCRHLYTPAMEKLGYTAGEGDSQNDIRLRASLFGRLASAEGPEAVRVAREMYNERETKPIPADLQQAVFVLRVKEGGLEAVREMQQLVATTTDSMERSRALRAMAVACPDHVSVKELFDYAFSDKVRSQDSMYLLGSIAARPKANKEYAHEIMARWDYLLKQAPGFIVGRMIKFVEYGTDMGLVDELKAFWETVSEEDKLSVRRSFNQGVEGLENNAKWVQRDAASILTWLKKTL
ncbi:cytosol alanyl aminopeptidase [Angomonas deanei]|nr:cytosol alanyl aminopeptidase [Angomonas deanei]|eukprot:EPY37412.1 cytosol alanyl aminopeptidase [Angomonas deanei]